MNRFADIVQRWLPVPIYPFVGGPLDGQRHKVKMVETADGVIPPEIWAIDELPDVGPVRWSRTRASPQVGTRRHLYRFEPTRSANEGRYVLVAEARQNQ